MSLPLRRPSLRGQQAGFSLIELMIGMTLGLLVIGAVISVLLSSLNSYRTSKTLLQFQDSARFVFDMMGRDIREAGATPCGANLPVANRVRDSAGNSPQWANLVGLDGGSLSAVDVVNAKPDSELLYLTGVQNNSFTVTGHVANSVNLEVSVDALGYFAVDELAFVCDQYQAALFKITKLTTASSVLKVQANSGSGVWENCNGSTDPAAANTLGLPACSGQKKSFAGGQLSSFKPIVWYLGCPYSSCNTSEEYSIYRTGQLKSGSLELSEGIEIVPSVVDLQFKYLLDGGDNYVAATSVANWAVVKAVAVTLKFQKGDISRTFTNRYALRNRL